MVIAGDCRPVLRFAAGLGRLARPEVADSINFAVSRAAGCGWALRFLLIDRRDNVDADQCARGACLLRPAPGR